MSQRYPIPEGYHSVTPSLSVYDAKAAIEFYKRAFGAESACAMMDESTGKVMHAEIRIGDSAIMLADEYRAYGCVAPTSLGGTPVTLHIYVEDVDAAFERAVLAGAEILMPLENTFWGDRYGKLLDPFGHRWSLASRIREVSREEMKAAMAQFEKECQKQTV